MNDAEERTLGQRGQERHRRVRLREELQVLQAGAVHHCDQALAAEELCQQ
jgi:hypothetical protein